MKSRYFNIVVILFLIMSFHMTYVPCEAESLSTPQKVLLVVASDIYDPISAELNQFASDLQAEGYTPFVYRFTSGAVVDLKNVITSYYDAYHIGGVLFIGDLPIAEFEIACDFGSYGCGYGYTQFPIDLFYMDLDGTWDDADQDGIYDDHRSGAGDRGPEIWLGRLTASPIFNSGLDEVGLLRNYFAKNHSYRTGGVSVDNKALAFHDDDWSYWREEGLDEVYPAVTVIHDELQTNASNYASKLRENYEWIHVCTHSNSYANYFRVNGSYGRVTTHEIQAIDPTTLFYNLFACSNCRYTITNYMGGRYIFTPTYGLAAVGSTKTGSMLYFRDFYNGLGKQMRNNLGDAYKDWFHKAIPTTNTDYYEYMRSWFYGMTLLGDPTLTISPPMAQINSVFPVSIKEGETVFFDGAGTVRNGSVSAYAWRSDIDGFLDHRSQFSAADLSVGDHTIYFKVRDGLGRWSAEQRTSVTVDADVNLPAVSMITPDTQVPLAYTGGTMSGNASSPLGIDVVHVKIYDYGRAQYTVIDQAAHYDSQTGQWNFEIAAQHITQGAQAKIQMRARNQAGSWCSWRSKVIDIQTDREFPTVVIVSPTVDESVSPRGFTITGTATDATGVKDVRISVNVCRKGKNVFAVVNKSARFDSTTGTWNYYIKSKYVKKCSSARIYVKATDKAGNISPDSSSVPVTIPVPPEKKKPKVSIRRPSAPPSGFGNGFILTGRALDSSGIAEVRIRIQDYGRDKQYTLYDALATYDSATGTWSYAVSPSHITVGQEACIFAQAKDNNGNISKWKKAKVKIY